MKMIERASLILSVYIIIATLLATCVSHNPSQVVLSQIAENPPNEKMERTYIMVKPDGMISYLLRNLIVVRRRKRSCWRNHQPFRKEGLQAHRPQAHEAHPGFVGRALLRLEDQVFLPWVDEVHGM